MRLEFFSFYRGGECSPFGFYSDSIERSCIEETKECSILSK